MSNTIATNVAEDLGIRDERFEFEKDPKNQIVVASDPKRWHPKLKEFKNKLIFRAGGVNGRRSERKQIAIDTSAESRPRALAIANAICYAATKRCCSIEIKGDIGPLCLTLDSATVEIRITELQPLIPTTMKSSVRDNDASQHMRPLEITVGRQLYGEGVIRDGHEKVEDQLRYVFEWLYEQVVTMNGFARKKSEWDAGYSARNAEFLRLVELRKVEAANRVELHTNKNELIEDADKWQRATAIRAFVQSVVDANSADADSFLLKEWRDRALKTADEIDPTKKYAFVKKHEQDST